MYSLNFSDRKSPLLPFFIRMITLFFILFLVPLVLADLPQQLDPFLERLFETPECESFLADGSFLAVATRDCTPAVCDFPRQLCMRASSAYKDEAANQCRALPEQCLVAANGGQPLAMPSTAPPPPPPPPPPPSLPHPSAVVPPPAPSPELPVPAPDTQRPISGGLPRQQLPICEQDPPEGRFCGFSLKYAFNRETRSCDQFWFPGCRTPATNDNLFDTLEQCSEASRHCARGEPIQRPVPNPPHPTMGPPSVPVPPAPAPPPPPPQPPHPSGGGPLSGILGGDGSQAGQFIRMITNTIREVRERGGGGGGNGGGGGGLRFDPSQLGGLLQSFGRRRRR